jgi:RNA:NAD 2'-phosphotransferase (TPT1/KptA family)
MQEVYPTGLMDATGWVKVGDLLQVPSLLRFGGKYIDIIEQVKSLGCEDDATKRRLEIKQEQGIAFIRACQGHSLTLSFDEMLEKIAPDSSGWARHGLHGTFRRNMDSIIANGLDVKYSSNGSGRNRAHVHFAVSVNDTAETAGVRGGTDTIVECDLMRMHSSGMTLYRSGNNVILTPGLGGRVPPSFITRIYDKSTGKQLYPNRDMKCRRKRKRSASSSFPVGSASKVLALSGGTCMNDAWNRPRRMH